MRAALLDGGSGAAGMDAIIAARGRGLQEGAGGLGQSPETPSPGLGVRPGRGRGLPEESGFRTGQATSEAL